MTARDAGGIAAKIMAVFLALRAFTTTAIGISSLQLFGWGPEGLSWLRTPLHFFMEAGVYACGSALLWAKSRSFWRSDEKLGPAMDRVGWLRLGLLLIGIYFLVGTAPVALLTLAKSTLATNIQWPIIDRLTVFADCTQAIIAVLLIAFGIVGWAKPVQPDSDQPEG